MSKYEYLVFGGGGAAGCAYAGVFEALEKQPSFNASDIKAVAGTSVGAIAALIVALNFTGAEASKTLFNLDLKKMSDGGWYPGQVYRLFSTYGKFRGQVLYEFIKSILKEKTGRDDPEKITFSDLKALGFKDLYVIATKLYKNNNIPTGKQKIFSIEKTPETSVAAAILASTAAPIFFKRVRLKKIAKGKYELAEDGDLYEDGGIINNFAIDIFDRPKYLGLPDDQNNSSIINPHTLGFALLGENKIEDKNHHPVKSKLLDFRPIEYAQSLFNTLFNQVNHEKIQDEKNRKRTVQIDRKNVNLDDFDMSKETKLALIQSGKDAVSDYFANLIIEDSRVDLDSKVANEVSEVSFIRQALSA